MWISPKTKANYYLTLFSITKIPLLWFCRPKIVHISDKSIEIKIPLKRRTKNHLKSMYFWLLYLICSLYISYLLCTLFYKKIQIAIFLIILIFLITPTGFEGSLRNLTPALITFIFELIFENNFSTRSLRPLLLSVPLALFFFSILYGVKRKFFQN